MNQFSSDDKDFVNNQRQVYFFAGILFVFICILLLLSCYFRQTLVTVFLMLIAAAGSISASLWMFKRFEDFQRKISKGKLIARRFQNISRYFESILQDSTDIIFSVDTEGFILKFNKGAQLHFGYSQEEIVGKPLTNLFVNESDKEKIIGAVQREGKSVNEEIPMRTRTGTIILLNISISEMKNDTNQIIGLVATAKDITEKKKLEMELVKKNELLGKLAITDSLTDLYNSRHFHDQIKRELSRFKRNPGRKLSLILLDIDHFKELNDSEGHQMGDQVLRSLGKVIKVCIRNDVDMGFRYGGDEFIIILPDTDKNQALIVADRIQKQFNSFKFGKTSLSMGITEANAEENDQQFLKRADEAMYRSKKEGKNRITVD
ncbi:MAG: diguanylate cyclase [Fibrobacter sp.]|nr:diguanylate cyclase [Fibrobacter sp.]